MIDGGAYCTLSPVVLSRGTIHAAGPYFCPHVRIQELLRSRRTCHLTGRLEDLGRRKASLLALERHLDRVAQVVGLSPVEIRRRNFLKPGKTTITGQTVREEIDLNKLLDHALELSDYETKKEQFARHNPQSVRKKGIGLAAFCTERDLRGQASAT